jgi:hypothetical protein
VSNIFDPNNCHEWQVTKKEKVLIGRIDKPAGASQPWKDKASIVIQSRL